MFDLVLMLLSLLARNSASTPQSGSASVQGPQPLPIPTCGPGEDGC